MGLLQRHLEGIDHAEVVVLAFPTPGAGLGPGLHHEVVGFLEPFAVEQRVGIGGETLNARTAHEA